MDGAAMQKHHNFPFADTMTVDCNTLLLSEKRLPDRLGTDDLQ
jgi:hypothetical protein